MQSSGIQQTDLIIYSLGTLNQETWKFAIQLLKLEQNNDYGNRCCFRSWRVHVGYVNDKVRGEQRQSTTEQASGKWLHYTTAQ